MVKPMEEHFRTMAKKESIGGGTSKRTESNKITSENDFESLAKRRKLSNEFDFEKNNTFWTAKSKPSDANVEKTQC